MGNAELYYQDTPLRITYERFEISLCRMAEKSHVHEPRLPQGIWQPEPGQTVYFGSFTWLTPKCLPEPVYLMRYLDYTFNLLFYEYQPGVMDKDNQHVPAWSSAKFTAVLIKDQTCPNAQ